MKALRFLIVITVAAVVLLSGKPTLAYTVTVQVEGVVTGVRTYDGLAFDNSLTVGSIMTGSCTYDSETPDQDWPENYGLYSLISISMSVGNYTFTHNPEAAEEPYFFISSGNNGFYYDIRSTDSLFYGPSWINGEPYNLEDLDLSLAGINLNLVADTKSPIGDALPDEDTFPDLSVFNETIFYVAIDSSPGFAIFGEITSITVIPEPGTVLLFALGGLALRLRSGQALLRNRRR